jgi:hypothetical protein
MTAAQMLARDIADMLRLLRDAHLRLDERDRNRS